MDSWSFRYFFFQAEDGIRDKLVTGVQTCALPICCAESSSVGPDGTGKCQYHQDQLKKIPRSLLDILELQGVGPQKARLFYHELNIQTLEELEAAAKAARLQELPGMNAKSEQNILKAIEVYHRAAGR